MSSTHDLDRFVLAQDATRTGLAVALAELRAGRKRSHWIWYVFPQLRGLGSSPMTDHYGIADIDEAIAYLRHPLLRARLLEAASLVLGQHRAGISLTTLMGSEVDVLKLVSSMTLFASVTPRLAEAESNPELCELIATAETLLVTAERSGYRRCAFTERRLALGSPRADR